MEAKKEDMGFLNYPLPIRIKALYEYEAMRSGTTITNWLRHAHWQYYLSVKDKIIESPIPYLDLRKL